MSATALCNACSFFQVCEKTAKIIVTTVIYNNNNNNNDNNENKNNNNIVQLGLDFKLNTKIGLDTTHPPTHHPPTTHHKLLGHFQAY